MRSRPIRAEASLLRHARDFFDHHLFGVMTLGQAVVRAPELELKIPGKRRRPRERLIVDFGGYTLVVDSPSEAPPLGHLQLLNVAKGLDEEGPLDSQTWERLGQIVKTNPPDPALTPRPNLEKESDNVTH